ncbi:OHCU decarboxylase [Oleiphilus sp. HI0009]|nr:MULTISPECIES: 2-oxo-4-hydroxy-4-carboxy-5-ureidoimidazoline decarboxylase [unclassified Oleiphilus]KZX78058.1 OHCU decarboxylase [Oleiphilus sp. HI0009]MCH2157457.1 2-oxo-4-hydroxy-4-carboxy-5-ureidoimidazoline decarboxylase [Oleiphilaceae bacterium]KZX79412.1 OHCU decarboxylase [Oleiphilus sp. HI0009]KZY63048.1 OHCU decarboxylase [Oleiphilus sp. HI0066]KZY77406.1 OHCU decarboxylase [Oleiphilus sp. HI0067]
MADLTYTIDALNALNAEDATFAFTNCCTSSRWVAGMVEARPFASIEACHQAAKDVWANMGEADFLEAFEGHPKIGDVTSLREKYAHTKKLASGEQSSVNEADDATIEALAQGNTDYEEKFGFIFIVCATGKSAAEMNELLQQRLPNDRETELQNAAGQQALITAIRIDKLLPSA